jgi:Uma2 family endonuclease
MSSISARAHDGRIIEPMSAPQVELDELYRMSTEEYHRLIEAGAFEDFPPCELIDGVLVRKDMKTPEHENAIAWLLQWLMFGVDQARFQVRVGSSLTLAGSEPEPDLTVISRTSPRPYHPSTAALAIEVSWSSVRRDLNRKAALYAEAGVDEYWVFDVKARRLVVHRTPWGDSYGEVREVRAGERTAGAPAGLPELVVDELLGATFG